MPSQDRAAHTPQRRHVAALISVAMPEEAQPFLDLLAPTGLSAPLVPGGAQAWSLALGASAAWPAAGADDSAPAAHTTGAPAGGSPAPAGKSAEEPTAWPAAGTEVVLVRSGIGLVAAASAVATVLTQVSPAVVISAGTTGGLGREVEVGDVCVSTDLAYTDVDATAFGYAIGQTPGQPATFPGDPALVARAGGQEASQALRRATPSSTAARIHCGQMLAGGSFVTAANVKDTRSLFPRAVSTDMESTALAQVAHAAGVGFASVRGVSDLCGPEAGQDFHIGAEEAAARSAAVVVAALAS